MTKLKQQLRTLLGCLDSTCTLVSTRIRDLMCLFKSEAVKVEPS